MLKSFIYRTDKFLSVIILLAAFCSCRQGNEQYTVEERTISEAVYASGEVYPQQYHFLKPANTAPVLQILVSEGDRVSAGDVLVILGNSDDSGKIRLASSQVAIAKENAGDNSSILKEIQGKIDIARQHYQAARDNAERYRKLAADKAVSQKEADDKALAAENGLAELTGLQEQYAATQNELNNRVLTAELQLADITRQYGDNTLRSNMSGVVYSILKRPRETADSRTPVLMVGAENSFKLELSIDERDISKIRTGQKVFFETNTYPDRLFTAEITKINPVMQRDSRYFRVEALISNTTFFYPQSSVEASIVIRKNAKAVMIPFDYLHKGDSVCLQSSGKSRMIPVGTGIRIGDRVEITEGITAGDTILKPSAR